MFGDLTNLGGAFDVIIVVVQILTFIVFLGGLAAFGWYLWQVWRGKRRWWAKIWSVALFFAGAGHGLVRLRLPPAQPGCELLMTKSKRVLSVTTERLRLAAPFRISGYVFEHSDVIVATVSEGGQTGRGEAAGVYYLGDDVTHMIAEIETFRGAIEKGADRAELQRLMPPGGARNALDCALWELEAAQAGRPVWQLAGVNVPQPLRDDLHHRRRRARDHGRRRARL